MHTYIKTIELLSVKSFTGKYHRSVCLGHQTQCYTIFTYQYMSLRSWIVTENCKWYLRQFINTSDVVQESEELTSYTFCNCNSYVQKSVQFTVFFKHILYVWLCLHVIVAAFLYKSLFGFKLRVLYLVNCYFCLFLCGRSVCVF